MDTLADVALGLGRWVRPVPPPITCTHSRPLAHSSPSPSALPSSLSASCIFSHPLSHFDESEENMYSRRPEPLFRLTHHPAADHVLTTRLRHPSPERQPVARKARNRAPSVMDMEFLVNGANEAAEEHTRATWPTRQGAPDSSHRDRPPKLCTLNSLPKEFRTASPQEPPSPTPTEPSPEYQNDSRSFSVPSAVSPPSVHLTITTLADSVQACRQVSREKPAALHMNHKRPANSTEYAPRSPNDPITPAASPQKRDPSLPIAVPLARKRSRISPEQLAILDKVFAQTFFPTTSVREAIAHDAGMTPRSVQVWFQNRRQQWRARHGSTAAGPASDAPHPTADPSSETSGQYARGPRVMIKAGRGRPRLEHVPRATPSRPRTARTAMQVDAAPVTEFAPRRGRLPSDEPFRVPELTPPSTPGAALCANHSSTATSDR